MVSIESLSLPEKIGQMLCLGFTDDKPGDAFLNVNEQARRVVTELHAGTVILFARNVQRPGETTDSARVKAMVDELQSLARVPLFVAVDQEGGRVARFGAPFTAFPSAQAIGSISDPELVVEAARIIGTELLAVGVNFNFAPVADINSNPANPVIGDRSFGGDPVLVSSMVMAQSQGYHDAGILACAKHFPGHGDTDLDSHFALPTIRYDRDVIENRELMPFAAAVRNEIPAIMTAHILFPALDPSGVPATLSKPILTDLLRGELGFDGLIVTDCLQMKAVADTWGTPRAAVMAAQAGADILLVCHDAETQRTTFDALLAAVHSGELSEARIDESVARILAAKEGLAMGDIPALFTIGSPEHLAFARSVYEAAGQTPPPSVSVPTLGERTY
ncbi:MAG: beta-N-acetylhexosaminidase [Armatimonadetes bacterium]|nr:beta-N-acetylhexosaminidase [Armatimonadota bacterium]